LLGKKTNGHSSALTKVAIEDRRDPFSMLDAIAADLRREKESNAYLRSLADNSDLPICIIDNLGFVSYQNKADKTWYKKDLLGEEMCPTCRADNPEGGECVENCSTQESLSVGDTVERYTSVNGVQCRIIAFPTSTTQGTHVAVITVGCPELEMVSAERDMLKEQISFILENSKIPMIFGDKDQKIEFVSPEFLELFDVDKKDISTTAEFWALLATKIDAPGEAVNIAKNARMKNEPGRCNVIFSSGGEYKFIVQPAISSRDNELIGVMCKFIKR